MKKIIKIGVADFALPAPRVGSIEQYSGFGRGAVIGIELHQKIQAARRASHADYQAEVKTSHRFEIDNYSFEVSGRMDGVFQQSQLTIEEIKTAFNVKELHQRLLNGKETHPYCLQLKTYGYLHWLKTKEMAVLRLHLVSSRNGMSIDLELELITDTYEGWLALRLRELALEAKRDEQRGKRRKHTARQFQFPYLSTRPGQVELMTTIENGMQAKQRMLIQAPTGLGKTIGVLYPVLKEALTRGQKVIYVTPKNSQHAIAEDAIARLQETGARVKSMTLSAKSKMCFKQEVLCNPDYCEFAKDHYTKVAKNSLPEKLAKKKLLNAKTFKKLARQYEVCPAELQFEAISNVEAVICDYNYVFSPRADGKLTTNVFAKKSKPNLIIDEAHNLPARAMDYYSPALAASALETLRQTCEILDAKFKLKTQSMIDECVRIIKTCSLTHAPCKIDPPLEPFMTQDEKIQALLTSYLEADVEIAAGDPIMELSHYWSEFTAALEFIALGKPEFFVIHTPKPLMIRIICCDAAEMLTPVYADFAHTIGFSATLKPFDYYRRLSGLEESILTAEFICSFPRENRKLLIIPQISTKYSDRARSYPRIAETIHKISALKSGNYFIFLPSFEFLERLLEIFISPAGFSLLRQRRGMPYNEVNYMLEKLKDETCAHFLFAVQGGIFSEGVDYPGDMAIGVFIVGPPLPNYDLERESMKRYYEEKFSQGFDYAYTYPAMAKAIQAAGRLIRSETDKGIIILMDNRFLQTSFVNCMPKDWFEYDVRENVSAKILQDIADFWKYVQTRTKSLASALADYPD
jgi:DNA excision repair protein ERCC-2